MKIYIKSSLSSKSDYYENSITGIAYKLFTVENGKLYPPKVANAGHTDTPMGVWLDAEEGEFVELEGLKRVIERKTNYNRIAQRVANLANLEGEERKAEIRKLKRATLAYRPGWHLGDSPRASQFDASFSWVDVGIVDESSVTKSIDTYSAFRNSCVTGRNVGNIYYVRDIDSYLQIIGESKVTKFLPFDCIWAKCTYIANIDYHDEEVEQGHIRHRADGTFYRGKDYQHSLGGLRHIPTDGYYRYRTNPNPDTVPWVITGAMKVLELLGDNEVNLILEQDGIAPVHRQGGDLTVEEILNNN